MNTRKQSKIRETLSYFLKVRFEYINLSLANKAVILLSIIGIVSLFMPWIIDNSNNLEWNSFHSISGNIGFILFVIYLFLIFILVSNNHKEKIRLYTDINFKNYLVTVFAGLIAVFSSIISISFINGLSTLEQNISHGNGLILSSTIGIIVIIFGFIIRNDSRKSNAEIVLEQLSMNREKNKEKDNMTLPI